MPEHLDSKKVQLLCLGPQICEELNLEELLGDGFKVHSCSSRQSLSDSLAEDVPDVVVAGVEQVLGNDNLLQELQRRYFRLPVVVVVEAPDTETVVRCVKDGAYEVVARDELGQRLPAVLRRAAQEHRMMVEVDQLEEAYKRRGSFGGRLVGASAELQRVYTRILRVARTDTSVFLVGESGTGKELVAHTIHELSPRRDTGQIVCVNCSTIPKDLLESELFGHEKGAFTGADRRRIGRCEQADGGTLFLDEICEMDVGLQSKLLRFLEERDFTRVGGSESIQVDTRLVTATNREPREEIRKGRLREDLFFRLNVVPIHLPPLRERREDIPVLLQHFLEFYGEKHNKYFWDFSPEAMRILLCYEWPGNVRELRNTIERIVVLSTSDTVVPQLLPEHIRESVPDQAVPELSVEEALSTVQEATRQPAPTEARSDEVIPLDELEKQAILNAVRKYPGNISQAARKLGLSRATMYRKLSKYGVK